MRRTTALLAAAALAVPLAACDGEQQLRDVPEGEVTSSEVPEAPATEVNTSTDEPAPADDAGSEPESFDGSEGLEPEEGPETTAEQG